MIRSSDVLDTTNSFDRKVLLLDCKSLSDLEAVSFAVDQPDLNLIIHMAESELINNDSYIQWMQQKVKNPNCIHLLMDENHPNVDLNRIYKLQTKLNLMNSDFFKLLPLQTKAWEKQLSDSKSRELRLREKLKIIQAHSGMFFRLKPFISLDLNSELQKIDNKESRNEIFNFYETDPKIKIDGIEQFEKGK